MFKNGLLLLSTSAFRVETVLKKCNEIVQNCLYVQLINVNNLSTTHPNFIPLPRTKSALNFISHCYSHTATEFKNLNVVFIISNFSKTHTQHKLSKDYEVILTDLDENYDKQLQTYVFNNFPKKNSNTLEVKRLVNLEKQPLDSEENTLPVHQHTCVGGTFDRLHAGHKILLNHTLFSTSSKLTVGVTDGDINKKKVLYDLMEPIGVRMNALKEFLADCDPSKEAFIVPIVDMFGPTITDDSIDCLVVSEETRKGGAIVNQERVKKGMSELEVDVLELVNDRVEDQGDELKVSSSKARKRLLGTLLKPPQQKDGLAATPYLIGLTGSIASGKSSVCKRLEALGAGTINCDALGHESYLPGTQAYDQIISHFGAHLVDKESKLIDRTQLASIVFKDKDQLAVLNSIVWPAIRSLVGKYVQELVEQGKEVIVLDAAVLLEAGWDKGVHEVWLSIIDPLEAEHRIMERNKISAEQARERISSQMSNQQRLQSANVVLCTQWQYEYTQKQVEKAWSLLQGRMP